MRTISIVMPPRSTVKACDVISLAPGTSVPVGVMAAVWKAIVLSAGAVRISSESSGGSADACGAGSAPPRDESQRPPTASTTSATRPAAQASDLRGIVTVVARVSTPWGAAVAAAEPAATVVPAEIGTNSSDDAPARRVFELGISVATPCLAAFSAARISDADANRLSRSIESARVRTPATSTGTSGMRSLASGSGSSLPSMTASARVIASGGIWPVMRWKSVAARA